MSAEEGRLVLPGLRISRREVPPSLRERYADLQFLGEGGMGVVYCAVDPRLGRKVALKLLKGDDPERRFIAEARSQARIQHEHICRVYEAGEADGEPFIAMQFIDGEPLSKMRERLTLEERVFLMKEVALAVHEAHRIGLIHRDLKPGNILVEEREDGSKKPWVMDFGLARDVEEKGQTQTGAVIGTVAFMPPEQARGDVRSMDRRSDVYSLGATLYDVIAGRPPFVAEHPWKLLMMVGYEDAPSLGKIKKGVPDELQTIVMKCLEREPSRRYDSARALAEDLRRFLDGEPILAKRASFFYVALKKVKKNKVLSAALLVVLLGSLSFAGVWIRAQRQAAARERLAQELGESVKEMELFLRAAYELPLHDVERERDVVRARLLDIESRFSGTGSVGEGPLHYAIGRGHLALGDPALAREHLEKAIAAGYSSADLEYALGRALGELFRRAVEETKRITNKEEQKKKIEELERTLRDPALAHLRRAEGARIESPLYAEGLVALYEGKNEQAIEKARLAFEKAPWMYEPKKLEGDALFAEGSKYRHDAAFDYEKMKGYFEPAAAAYKIAGEIGSSDPDVYRAECELWEKMGHAAFAKGTTAKREFEVATAACANAVAASSKDGRTRIQRAQAMAARFSIALDTDDDEDAAGNAALSATEEALQFAPQDVMALYTRASTLTRQTLLERSRGQDVNFTKMIDAFQKVIDVDARFSWALNELGQVYLLQADVNRLHGQDPSAAFDNARQAYDRAIETDPSFSLPVYGKVRASIYWMEYEMERGLGGGQPLASLSDAVAFLEKQKLGGWVAAYWIAKAYRVRAAYELSDDKDPRPSISEAVLALRPFKEADGEGQFVLREMLEVRLVESEYALARGISPLPDIRAECEVLRRSIKSGEDIDGSMLLARIALIAARAQVHEKHAREVDFDSAIAPLRILLSKERQDPRLYQIAAEIHAAKASWLAEEGRATEREVAEGLVMVNSVLGLNRHQALAYALRGVLLLARARAASGETRNGAARAAREAFETAYQENPRLMNRFSRESEILAAMF